MAKKNASKRVTLQQKYKIQKRVKEHKRKLKKAAKKNGLNGTYAWRSKQEANIPNDWPFKDQMLSAIERQRELEKAAEEKNKAVRKAAAEKKKRDAADGKATTVPSALPKGMGAPVPVPMATQNAIVLDAYTRRVWREIKQVAEESDIILEVLDARDPLGSRCFEIEQWVSGKLQEKTDRKAAASKSAPSVSKPIILVLNKCDLIPVSVTQAWIEFFAKHDHLPAIAFYSNRDLEKSSAKGQVVSPKDLCVGAESLLQLIANFQSSADEAASEGDRKPLKVGIIGFGNVGKSSVLNTLARTHASGVGAVSGYTKEIHRVKLGKGLYAIDTPAVPQKDDAPGPHTQLPLSNTRIVDDVADFVEHFDVDNLMSVLGLPAVESMKEFMDGLASRAGRQMKGGEFNHIVAARKLFKDWNEGRLLFFTPPPQLDDEEEESPAEAGPIQSFFVASNKKTIAALKKRTDIPPEGAFLSVNGSLFDEGEEEDDEDGEDEEGEDDDEDGEMEIEVVEDDEDEEMQEDDAEEEEVVVPPPSKKKGKAASAAAPAPAVQPSSSKKAKRAAVPEPEPEPTPAPKSNKKAKTAAAAPAPAPVVEAAPAAAPAKSRKRAARDEEEEEAAPAPKKQAAAPKKEATKPTPTPKKAAAAPVAAPTPASAKKGKGKK